ncbi:MAG: hypothetical protein NC037_01595 [Bacteroides sp.]|nr:hypothetical protein [Bacillota bacterium]MCM1455208.1 hypothetical protein [Bacteroides sp.]
MKTKTVNRKIVAIVAVIALAAILAVCLVACNNQDTYEKQMKDKGYTVAAMTAEQIAQSMGNDVGEVDWAIVATKGDMTSGEGEYVSIVKFKKESDAKDCVNKALASFEQMHIEGYAAARDGKVVFVGTENAVKDAK